MKCWIIVQGEYSDYHIVGIFTTLAGAEKVLEYIKQTDNMYEPTIEEHELDPCVNELNAGLIEYTVRFDDIKNNYTVNLCVNAMGPNLHWRGGSVYSVWARDLDHAVKIALDRNAKYLAMRITT